MFVKVGIEFTVSIEPDEEIPDSHTKHEYVSPFLLRRLRSFEEALADRKKMHPANEEEAEDEDTLVRFMRAA